MCDVFILTIIKEIFYQVNGIDRLNTLYGKQISAHLIFSAGLLSEFDNLDKTNPNCVLIGDAAEKFSYQNLNNAFRILLKTENPLLLSLGQG